jgi:hypothetical protein
MDTIKTSVQASESEGMAEAASRLLREGGLLRLFRGWQGAFSRGVVGSAITLAVYDSVKESLA